MVIVRVISKSDECKARGQFEIPNTITPRIVLHSVQLLLVSITSLEINKVFGELLLSEKVGNAFP